MSLSEVQVFVFDVFGTCVDWKTSVINELKEQVKPAPGSNIATFAYESLANQWRQNYYASMREYAKTDPGDIPDVDIVYRQGLDKVLSGIQHEPIDEGTRNELTQVWHRLVPWVDTNEGLEKLNTIAVTATLSNGTVRLLLDLKKNGNMPFDTIFSAELFQAYKPNPKVYLGAVELLKLKPHQVCLVAAHPHDLLAAKECGLKTAFVYRPSEHNEYKLDFVDINVDSIAKLADHVIQNKK
ncbi:haloacid dehalogenase, type II [Phascolomyces articulosus]|uniref:Haloacid dehalogenase, type II n=1 Tax=Phascolomyces articulosus TaxID=60185 RepID=A0AAD5PAQ1_9FUNG|nr:haloacid dehalogenase, type II [Phascolomyces articulosus]